jgi:hypothetical protein
MTFNAGDVVQVDYKSPKLIEEWMRGERPVGPGEVGVVKFAPFTDPYRQEGVHNFTVTVTFPMLGTFGVHSANLKIVQKAENNA